MKLPQLADELIQAMILDHLDNVLESTTAIERKLQVLGSEFRPHFHELNAKINELSKRIEQHRFDDDHQDDENGGQEPPSSPAP